MSHFEHSSHPTETADITNDLEALQNTLGNEQQKLADLSEGLTGDNEKYKAGLELLYLQMGGVAARASELLELITEHRGSNDDQ